MMDFGISFSHEENSWMLLVAFIVLALMVRSAWIRKKAWKLLGLDKAEPGFQAPVNRALKNILYWVGLVFACLAALGPQWGQKNHPVKAQGLDICFAIDLSRSMMAEDLTPNRLGQAKNQLEIFLPRLGGDRAALVGFAGSSYVAAPLSVDHASLTTFLDPMSPEIISDQATNLASGVDACLSALGLDDVKDRNQILDDAARLIVLISDGEDTAEEGQEPVVRAEKLGVPVFAMAMGTEKGAPIPIRENGKLLDYVKDPETRQPVLSKLAVKGLRAIADKTGGKVFYGSSGVEAWKDFENAITDFKRESRDAGTKLDKEERFQWPLAVAFALLLLDFLLTETKWVWKLGLLLLAINTSNSQAASSDPGVVWWNNKGVGSFKAKDLKEAERNFTEALTENAGDPTARFNWATNKLHGAVDPETGKADPKAVEEAVNELEKLRSDPHLVKESPAFRARLDHQLGQAYEMKNEVPKALGAYYRSEAQSASDPKQKELTDKTRGNIARLLVSPPQQQQQQQQQGGGGGGEQDQKKDDKDGQGKDEQQNKQYSQSKRKAKFSDTDVSESEARQILESVSGEEKDVLKRKAKGEAKEQGMRQKRDARERGDTGRGKAW